MATIGGAQDVLPQVGTVRTWRLRWGAVRFALESESLGKAAFVHVRRALRRCGPSKSWHSWYVFPSFPSGSSILSLLHSQVRSRISSARSNSRFRLVSGPQCSSIRSWYRLVNLA